MTSDANTALPRKRRRLLWAAVLLIPAAAAPIVWRLIPSYSAVLTDGDRIREPIAKAVPRSVLWQPPLPFPLPINTTQDDYEPRVSLDGDTLVFVRGKAGGGADLFEAYRTRNGWSDPKPIDSINSEFDELGPEFSPDAKWLLFYSDRLDGFGGYDVWLADRTPHGWSVPENAGAGVNTGFNEYGPAMTPDGRTLYFASNRPRMTPGYDSADLPDAWPATLREDLSKRDYDLYASHRTDGVFTTSTPLDALNTPSNEGSPVVAPFGDFLYFASDRPGGQGGFDLYRSRIRRGVFDPPKELGSVVNTPSHELDPGLTLGGYALFFSSNRNTSKHDASRDYDLLFTTSREVFREDEWIDAAPIPWAAIWSQVLPNLFWVLLALTLLFLLALLWGALRHRKLTLLARCFLASLFAHLMLLLLCNVWEVTAAIAGVYRMGGPIQVNLASALEGDALSAQITSITSSQIEAPTAAPSERQDEIAMPVAAESRLFSASPIAFDPRTAAPLAPQAPAQVSMPIESRRVPEVTVMTAPPMATDVTTPETAHRRTAESPPIETKHHEFATAAVAKLVIPTVGRSSPAAILHSAVTPLDRIATPRLDVRAPQRFDLDIANVTLTHPIVSSPIAPKADQGNSSIAALAIPSVKASTAGTPDTASESHLPVSPAVAPSPRRFNDAPIRTDGKLANIETVASEFVALPQSKASFPTNTQPVLNETPRRPHAPSMPSSTFLAGDVTSRLPAIPAPSKPSDAAANSTATVQPVDHALPQVPWDAESTNKRPQTPVFAEFRPVQTSAPVRKTDVASPLPIRREFADHMEDRAVSSSPSIRMNPTASALLPQVLRVPKETEPAQNLFPQRAPEERLALVEKQGGSKETEDAVALALRWLARHQSADGSWNGTSFDDSCSGCDGQTDADVHVALTGLSLLAFLAADHTHVKEGPYQSHVRKGIQWLASKQTDDGDLRVEETMYSHGIATMALSEALAMTNDPRLRPNVQRAVMFIDRSRNPETGGWRYDPGQDGDTSVLGWQALALKSASAAGISPPKKCLDAARSWLDLVSNPQHPGVYSYQPGREPTPTMTAEGMFVQLLLGLAPDDPRTQQSMEILKKNPPNWDQVNTYYWYYGTLALHQVQGEAWRDWNSLLVGELLSHQEKSGTKSGSWNPEGPWADIGGRVYQTAICALMLEVYYRYLPMYAEPEALTAIGSMQGTVVDAKTRLRIPGATVRVDHAGGRPAAASTDASGSYVLGVPNVPEHFAVSVFARGYVSHAENIHHDDVQGRSLRKDFALQPERRDVVALELIPSVHHLGDDRFEGVINSRFQKASEGSIFSSQFSLDDSQHRALAGGAEICLLAKGVQRSHELRINDERLDRRLDRAPRDGSFGEFCAPIDAGSLRSGSNLFEIHAGSLGDDVDDFEFVNVLVRVRGEPRSTANTPMG